MILAFFVLAQPAMSLLEKTFFTLKMVENNHREPIFEGENGSFDSEG